MKKYRYAAIGEFHLYGADADLPVPRRMVELAREHKLFLHAHSDVDAVERLFRQWPQARILWAHAVFERPERVAEMLKKHKNLWCDLAFRTDHASNDKVDPAWRSVFLQFPDRFMVGTDSYTPERWHYIPGHAEWSRRWLSDLPRDVAERIAWKNGETVFGSLRRTDLSVWACNEGTRLESARLRHRVPKRADRSRQALRARHSRLPKARPAGAGKPQMGAHMRSTARHELRADGERVAPGPLARRRADAAHARRWIRFRASCRRLRGPHHGFPSGFQRCSIFSRDESPGSCSTPMAAAAASRSATAYPESGQAIALGGSSFSSRVFRHRLGAVRDLPCAVPAFQMRGRAPWPQEVIATRRACSTTRFYRWYGWDGAQDSLWAQSIRPLLDEREMRASPAHVAATVRTIFPAEYAKAFGRPPPDSDEAVLADVGKSLAAFQETLVSARTPFDEFRDALQRAEPASYPLAAQRGLRIFVGKGNCSVCHFGPQFTNGEFAETGISFFAQRTRR